MMCAITTTTTITISVSNNKKNHKKHLVDSVVAATYTNALSTAAVASWSTKHTPLNICPYKRPTRKLTHLEPQHLMIQPLHRDFVAIFDFDDCYITLVVAGEIPYIPKKYSGAKMKLRRVENIFLQLNSIHLQPGSGASSLYCVSKFRE